MSGWPMNCLYIYLVKCKCRHFQIPKTLSWFIVQRTTCTSLTFHRRWRNETKSHRSRFDLSDWRKHPVKIATEIYPSIHINFRLTCESQGGNPWPRLTFVINGSRVDPDALEPLHYGYNAVKILKVTWTYELSQK